MYSASIHCVFSSDESDNMELEVSMRDSEGKDLSAYAAGDDITTLLGDIADQLDGRQIIGHGIAVRRRLMLRRGIEGDPGRAIRQFSVFCRADGQRERAQQHDRRHP